METTEGHPGSGSAVPVASGAGASAGAGGGGGFDRLADLAMRLLSVPGARLVVERGAEHEVIGSAGSFAVPSGTRVDPAEGLCALVLQAQAPVVIDDAAADPRSAGRPSVVSGRAGAYLGVPLREDGVVTGVLCAYADRPRRWAAAELRALEQLADTASAEVAAHRLAVELESTRVRTDLAADAAGVGGFDWDLRTDELRWDDRLHELFGRTRATFAGTIGAFSDAVHPDDRERVGAALQSAVDERGDFGADYRIVRPDGEERWISARGKVLSDPGGRAVRLVGAALDTTEAHDRDAQRSRVLEVMPAGFLSLDREFRMTYLNGEGERILGGSREDVLGRVLFDVYPATRGTVYELTYRRVLASGQPETFEAYYPAPLDAWYELRVWPSSEGLSLYFLDITARRSAQERADRSAARLALLARTTDELTAVLDARAAVARLAEVVVPALGQWSVVSVIGDDGQVVDVGWHHVDPASADLVRRYAGERLRGIGEDAPLRQAVRTGRPVVVPSGATGDVVRHLRPVARGLLEQLAPEGFAVLPLVAAGRALGVLTLYTGPERGLDDEDVATAVEVAARAGAALENARLYEEQRDLATALQRSLLTEPPEPDHAEVVVRYAPAAAAAQVGGDWYDAFLQRDGATVIVIGDVIGHDTAAAAAMGQVRGLLRGVAATTGAGPAEVLERLDGAMALLQVTTTATAVVLRLEQGSAGRARGTTAVRWSNAGHPPPLVLHDDGRVEVLDGAEPDLLLGIDPAERRREQVVEVDRGATVLLCTDGLVERRGQSLDDGIEALAAALAELGRLPLQELCDALLARLLPERPEDDVALVAVRLHDQDAPRPAEAGPNRVPDAVPTDPAT